MGKKKKGSKLDIRTDLLKSFGTDVFSSSKVTADTFSPQETPDKSRPEQDGGRKRHNPLETANWFSKIFFCWVNGLMATGYRRKLEQDDMYPLRECDTAETATNEFRPYWEREVKNATPDKPPRFLKALIRCYGLRYFLMGFVSLLEEATEMIEPFLIAYIIKYFEPNSGVTREEAYMYAGIIAGMQFLDVIIGYYEWPVDLWGFRMETAIVNVVYEKILRLSTGGLSKTSTGQIVNILDEDVEAFEDGFDDFHELWISPIIIVFICWYLLYYIGISVLAGLGYIFLMLVLEGAMMPLHIKYSNLENVTSDARVDKLNQIIQSMKMIKLQAWEKPFSDVLQNLRKAELWAMLKGDIVMGVLEVLEWVGMDPATFLILMTYVLMGNVLTAEKAFILMMFLEELEDAIDDFPEAMESMADVKVSVTRLETFLLLEEHPESAIDAAPKGPDESPSGDVLPKGVSVDISNAKWKKTTTLSNVKFDVNEGELIAVIGPSGAGKTALLCTLLRELVRVEGKVEVRGTVAFTAQEPWVYPDTVRNNIVDFGKPFDQEKYERALSISDLKTDLKGMPYGDRTFVGDMGGNLSGGQRARLGLARAVYVDADIYLLDDPLSAVDAAVGRKVFNKCILGALGSKTRILVTHQLQFVKQADKVLVLDEGDQVAFGTYEEVVASGADFTELLSRDDDYPSTDEEQKGSVESFYGSRTSVAGDDPEMSKATNFVEEERVTGSVSWRVYLKYITAGPPRWFLFVLVPVLIAFEALDVLGDWWVAHWVDTLVKVNKTMPNGQPRILPDPVSIYHLKVYAILEGVGILLSIAAAVMLIYATYIASVNIHNMMFNAIVRVPISFFDKNPSGRILNRFSDDLEAVEDDIPEEIMDGTEALLGLIGSVVMICIGNPWAILPTIPLAVFFIAMYIYYIDTERHLGRLAATTSSPIYTHVSAISNGLWTIRALSAQESFKRRFRRIVDRHNEVEFVDLASESWYEVRVELLDAVFVTCVTFLCIFSSQNLGAGLVGLVLTYTLDMSETVEDIIESLTEMESVMIHAERAFEYAELTPEAPWETDDKPPPDWPAYGAIDLRGVSLSYDKDGPAALKNINLSIHGGEKVGIVGRTGAGKSSLMMALMRLVEPTGSIRIDGVDIAKLGLHDLRKRISIIQQDPVVIQDSIRKNLDPMEIHSDHALWTALDEVHLAADIRRLKKGLDTFMGKSGKLSVGQKQLLCLARTVLSYNRILLFDEATANIDLRADRLIQTTIRERFKHCTVLTIAHRLHTVMDSDRILVIEDGRVAEFDEPHLLLTERPDGALARLVSETGEAMERDLREAAHQSYLQKHEQKKSQ
ncbi:PREDICTED: multidrug resistance-associated protein 4-like [Branchiostoma belcheri]|uniref:Multidrug resistance-associated protein 4-like n=1 Tax=Branchiostoma belcheri TaxID=7741 RepID=A0A6P4YU29_BRABE|nr:PREDICTED: multidrug resistance-associated protein 4-like [Branchiostoma belcheri]